jgi:hypothetical protein
MSEGEIMFAVVLFIAFVPAIPYAIIMTIKENKKNKDTTK